MASPALTPESLARLHAAGMTGSRPWSRAEFADLLARSGVFAVGDAQGAALGRVILDEAELLTLVSHPAARRRGHGRAALAAFHSEALTRGAVSVFLEVDAANAPALALYRSCGYAQTGCRRGYYAHPGQPASDALTMTLRLGRAA